MMKQTIFATLATVALLGVGCVSTVSDTHTFAMSYGKDSVAGRYQRSVDQVYKAATDVVALNGTIVTEYIPHDNTNTVRSVTGRINDCKVWVRVEAVDPKVTQVDVQARTKWGTRELDLVHEIEKEIALKLVQ